MFAKNRFERFHLGRKDERENDLRQELKIFHQCSEKHIRVIKKVLTNGGLMKLTGMTAGFTLARKAFPAG